MLDLSEDIRSLVEGGIRPLSVDEILTRAHGPARGIRKRSRHVAVGVAIVGVAALVATLVVVPQWSPGGAPQAAAASVLLHFASQADDVPSLGPGQYLYSETETPGLMSFGKVNEYLNATQQAWINAQGFGRFVVNMNPTPMFYSESDRLKWQKAGSPPFDGLSLDESAGQLHRTGTITPAFDIAPIPDFNVADLPTKTVELRQVLVSDRFNAELPTQILQCHGSANCLVVVKAAAILQGPDVGATPALRKALFILLSHVPGIVAKGTVRDRAGTSGIELSYVHRIQAHTEEIGCAHGVGNIAVRVAASSNRFSFVIDPTTARVIETEVDPMPPYQQSQANPCFASSLTEPQFAAPHWVTVVSEAVVSSDTSTTSMGEK